MSTQLTKGTGSSVCVDRCQISGSTNLETVLFFGYLPPVNQMHPIGQRPAEQPAYPAELLYCPDSHLVQIGLIVDPQILFAPDYPYTSGTTKILKDNFAELYHDVKTVLTLAPDDLVIDIGSNDGTLLSNFTAHRVLGIEPTLQAKLANERGIESIMEFFTSEVAQSVNQKYGQAKVITATNVFAHIENVHDVVAGILTLLQDDGVFISESHYLISLLETVQYDTIYHEHLRYYSLKSLQYLFEKHGLEIIHAKKIPTHGGSIRVYAARKGKHLVKDSVLRLLADEDALGDPRQQFEAFKKKVVHSKLQLYTLLNKVKNQGGRIYGIGAPSRASTLINYVGLDDGIIDAVMEVPGSHKIGKYMPGTLIPVWEETRLFTDQPEYALLFSWHIAEELIPKLAAKGFKGNYIVPLPEPRIVTP